ncbi:MAG: hypothetical protein JSS83_20120, partial [Cyanobacteria bacterium SZAS LIN-3]|nr:hypothetical protein [Cyanobacteria bacterium SZAS LIN-3]
MFKSEKGTISWKTYAKRWLALYMVPLTLALPLSLLSDCAASAASGSLADVPPDSVRIPPMVKEHSVSTYVPSEACKGEGVAVNLIYPNKARYKDGAPVAVVIPGGIGPNGLNFEMHASQVGVIEVRFAFPGGGTPQFGSAGTFDNRGATSLQALKDVILFAGGQKQDYKGRTINDLLKGTVKVQADNIGLVGWDVGGNQALAVLGKNPEALSFVKWLVFYESPVGAMFWPPALGSAADLHLNKHYREGSAATGNIQMDYRKLYWAESSYRNPNRLASRKRGSPGLKGVLFFDENMNGIWEESNEFAFTSALDPDLSKQYFPPQVIGAIQRVELFKGYWPKNIATQAETEKFFADRDGSLYVETVAREFPNLMVTIFGSAADHDQQQPDHPHIAFLYNLFLTHKVRFLRLNPDPNYMVAAAGMNHINFVNNEPNGSIDSDAIMSQLEPEGLVPDYVYIEGAVAEL